VQAASKLAQAAEMIAQHPGALQLRLYQTLVEVSGEASSTIVFPLPMDLGSAGGGGGATPAQIQAMMQSAVALAASQQATKALADAKGQGKDQQGQIAGDDDGGVRRLPGR
jgi:hypothetical protein